MVEKAALDIWDATAAAIKKHKITPVEMIGILLERAQNYHKFALRMERHGNYEDKADEA